MQELSSNNLKEEMTVAAPWQSVHLASKPWSAADGGTTNVTLEVSEKALAALDTGRVYIKWFSFRCRSQVRTYACHRFVGFDHRVQDCRVKVSVCRQCGQGADFKKSVHLASKPWSAADGGTTNVTLEVSEKALAALDTGRVYIKWFSFRCRSQVRTYACHRCVGFDHKVQDCRVKVSVCRQCGQRGHVAGKCTNPVDCRNCRFGGSPSGHNMLSASFPIYGAVLATVNARH
ncbi:hypothetical protein KR026_002522 [Drosophila bipectinata]|nr:hypothetical protein KR026_002522 [Drosophila bipectinata]